MAKFLFVVQNGIGFGHLRRALLIANEIEATEARDRCLIVSQARSTALIEHKGISAINIPELGRPPNGSFTTALPLILEEIISEFCPDVLIEDTHPLLLLRTIPKCNALRRILLVRRTAPFALEEMRHYGELGWYDRVIYMHSGANFNPSSFGGALHSLFVHSPRFCLVGAITAKVSDEQVRKVRRKYRRSTRRLIVVTCGAGGEHGLNRDAETVFAQACEAAKRIAAGGDSHAWVFVGGPYFDHDLKFPDCDAIFVKYEEDLPALLQECDAVIARPGFNVTHEALQGAARLILIPGYSYCESQHGWCRELSEYEDVHVVKAGDVEALINAVQMSPAIIARRRLKDGLKECVSIIRSKGADRQQPGGGGGLHVLFVPRRAEPALHLASPIRSPVGGEWSMVPEQAAQGLIRDRTLFWANCVEAFTFDWVNNQSPGVIITTGQDQAAWTIVSKAFGAEARGLALYHAPLIVEQFIQGHLDSLSKDWRIETGPVTMVVACDEVADAERIFGMIVDGATKLGIDILSQKEFVQTLLEQRLLTNSRT